VGHNVILLNHSVRKVINIDCLAGSTHVLNAEAITEIAATRSTAAVVSIVSVILIIVNIIVVIITILIIMSSSLTTLYLSDQSDSSCNPVELDLECQLCSPTCAKAQAA
jgi:hypothetical protein